MNCYALISLGAATGTYVGIRSGHILLPNRPCLHIFRITRPIHAR